MPQEDVKVKAPLCNIVCSEIKPMRSISMFSLLAIMLATATTHAGHNTHIACLSQYKPLVDCSNTANPSGFEVELFRRVSQQIPSLNFSMACVSFDELIQELRTPANASDKKCLVHMGGLSVMSSAFKKGVHFSLPTYEGGRAILVHQENRVDMFYFLRPFDAPVCICNVRSGCGDAVGGSIR